MSQGFGSTLRRVPLPDTTSDKRFTSGGDKSRSFLATTATWTDAAVTNAWETPGNWDINQVPNNNTFDVTIPIAAPCNFSSDFQIGALNLSVASARLNLVPGSRLVINSATGLNNNGTIVVNTTGANNTTTLRFDTSGSITGTGSVLLNGIGTSFNIADLNLQNFTVTHGPNHTIHGKGTIIGFAGATFINNGMILGDDSTGSMQLDLAYTANKNNSLIKATNGGVVSMGAGMIDQTGGGTILADGNGSFVRFIIGNNGTAIPILVGGTLNTANGGIIEPAPGGHQRDCQNRCNAP